jgi:hypothetical protein
VVDELLFEKYQAEIGTCFAIAHMKAISSLAVAIITVFRYFPVAISRLERLQTLTCHFQRFPGCLMALPDPNEYGRHAIK